MFVVVGVVVAVIVAVVAVVATAGSTKLAHSSLGSFGHCCCCLQLFCFYSNGFGNPALQTK